MPSPYTTTTTAATTPVFDTGQTDNIDCQYQHNLRAVDENGNTSLHVAAAEGHLDIVRFLLSNGLDANLQNKDGNTAVHFAVCQGHTEVVRCLLLRGAKTTLRNADGRNAEIAAIRSGFGDVVEIVTRINRDRQLEWCRQLESSSRPLGRVKLKVFGNIGVGKSTLIEALKCGYLGGLFRSTFRSSSSVFTESAASIYRSANPGEIMSESDKCCYLQVPHAGYTRGISVEQATLNGVGDVSVWEFSGYEPYHMTYDLFIGDSSCINVIVISLQDTSDIQLSQIVFWLNFIKTRLAPQQTFGFGGRLLARPHVMIVATHADTVTSVTDERRSVSVDSLTAIIDTVAVKFVDDFDVVQRVFAINCVRPTYAELKAVRLCLADIRTAIVSILPASTGLLEATITALPSWRKQFYIHPVLTWPKFADRVRQLINILCSLEHLHQLVYQLQLAGEIIYIEAADGSEDLVVISPQWLCSDVIGQLLSHDQVTRCRPIGRFSLDEVHLMFADSSIVKLVSLLQAMELCSSVTEDSAETVEFEFMCLNFVEASDSFINYDDDGRRVESGQAESGWTYGGSRLIGSRGVGFQLTSIFPRIQTRLRRQLGTLSGSMDCDLDQWYGGSRLVACSGAVQLIVSASVDSHLIDVKCRTASSCSWVAFQLVASVCRLVIDVLADCLPSLAIEQQTLSVSDLSSATSTVVSAYTPRDIRLMLQHDSSSVAITENVVDLLAFGSSKIFSSLTLSTSLPLSVGLSVSTRRAIARILDTSHETGHDWCMLALLLGIDTEELERLAHSPTDQCLAAWIRRDGDTATVSGLVDKLSTLGRHDAVDCLLSALPVFVCQSLPPTHGCLLKI